MSKKISVHGDITKEALFYNDMFKYLLKACITMKQDGRERSEENVSIVHHILCTRWSASRKRIEIHKHL